MRRLERLLIVLITLACASQPIALDACGAACERTRTGSPTANAPCHHAAAHGGQIGQAPRQCGQDHAVVTATSPTLAAAHAAPFSWLPAVVPALSPFDLSRPLPFATGSPGSAQHTPLRV